jgi:undecaprenyl-diphosphatase
MGDLIVLSIVQGVAEFLPVSSSGHLVIVQRALGIEAPGLRLDIFLHLGTLASVVVFYARTLRRLAAGLFGAAPAAERRAAWRFAGRLALSTVPAVAVYLLFGPFLEAQYENVAVTAVFLLVTGVVLIGTRFLPRGTAEIGFLRALAMGIGQAFALLPGVSRSGMTLACARALRCDPEKSAEFSFLMSLPLIAGAALLETVRSFASSAPPPSAPGWGETLVCSALAAVVGYVSLALLVKTLKSAYFWVFGLYCLSAGLLTLYLV